MKTVAFLILVIALHTGTYGVPTHLKKEELQDPERLLALEIRDSIPVPPDLPTGPMLYQGGSRTPPSRSPRPSSSKKPSPVSSQIPSPSKTPTTSPTKTESLPIPDLPPVRPSRTPTPSPKPEGSLPKSDLTPSPTPTGEYRCLSSDTNDPRDWNLETIEAYCTKAMLKCQCVLSRPDKHCTVKVAIKEDDNKSAIEEKNDGGSIALTEGMQMSAREEDNVLSFHEMCRIGWVQGTVCDPETMRCAIELYGRFVFGNGDGALVGHGSWWTICKDKLKQEGEI